MEKGHFRSHFLIRDMENKHFLASSEAVAVATISVFMAVFKQNMLRDMEKQHFRSHFSIRDMENKHFLASSEAVAVATILVFMAVFKQIM